MSFQDHTAPKFDGNSLTDMARASTEAAMTALIAAMTDIDAPAAARVSAAIAILDRGWGRPKQEVSGALGGMVLNVVTGVPRVSDD